MMFRALIAGVVVVGAALGWFMAAGPSLVLGTLKDDYVAAGEQAGIDMSACKARSRTLIDPSGGTAHCVQDVYRGVQKQITDMEATESELRSSQEAPSYDEPAEAPSYDEPAESSE